MRENYLDGRLQLDNPHTMSRLTEIDLEHVLRSVMMSLRSGVLTFLLHLASPHPNSAVRSVSSTPSVPLFPVYLIRESVLSHRRDKKN